MLPMPPLKSMPPLAGAFFFGSSGNIASVVIKGIAADNLSKDRLDLPMARHHSGSEGTMKIKFIVHEAEEGGYWAEVPALPGCATQGETMDELMANLREAFEGCLSIEVAPREPGGEEHLLDLVS